MSALDELFWRDEILQALFWMRGEGTADSTSPSEIARFLDAEEAVVGAALEGLAADGLLERLAVDRFRLTPLGVAEGGRRFRDEFAGLTQQAHGECGPGCWCHDPDHEGEPCPNAPQPEPERVRR